MDGQRRQVLGFAHFHSGADIVGGGVNPRGGDDVYPDLSIEARAASDGGGLLRAAAAFWAAGDKARASRALSEASERLPRRLFADAPDDPTAAEVWRGEAEQSRTN